MRDLLDIDEALVTRQKLNFDDVVLNQLEYPFSL